MTISNPEDLVPIIAIIGAILGLLLWIVKAQIHMSKQFEPNGGSTIKDSLVRIEHDQRYLRDRLDAHIDQHQKGNI
jgi:hypothetical protein